MIPDSATSRKLALGLARFVIDNGDKELKGELISAIICRIRFVDNYAPNDVDVICGALRILMLQLRELPKVTFAPEIWLPIFCSLTTGSVDPSWMSMAFQENVSELAEQFYAPEIGSATSKKCSEQITRICKEFALEIGLTRRLFAELSGANLEETTEKMISGKWAELHCSTSKSTLELLDKFFEKSILDAIFKMKDSEQFAREIFFVSAARVMKRFQELKTSKSTENISISLKLFDSAVKKTWQILYKDELVKKSTLSIFEQLLELAEPEVLQETMEQLKETCEWLKISAEHICEQIEGRLWRTANLLVGRLIELQKSIPYEIEYEIPDDFEAHCEQLPSNNKERLLRFMVEATRETLQGLMSILIKAKQSEEIVKFMKDSFPEMHNSNEEQICETAIQMYKTTSILSPDDELRVAQSILKTPALVRMPELIQSSKHPQMAREIMKMMLLQMAQNLELPEQLGLSRALRDSGEFWKIVTNFADKKMLIEMAQKLVLTGSKSGKEKESAIFALELFLTVLKLKLKNQKDSEATVTCNFDFVSLGISEEQWNAVGDKFDVSIIKRCPIPVALYTLRQLTTTELPTNELIYTVTHLKYLRSEEGSQTLKKFYGNVEGFSKILEKFMGNEWLTELCAKFLREFAKSIVTDERVFFMSFDHVNLLSWLGELGVLEAPPIIHGLVELCHSIESWDAQLLLGLRPPQCSPEDLRTFSSIWKCSAMSKLKEQDQKSIEEKVHKMLREHYEQQSELWKMSTNFNEGKLEKRELTEHEEQLMEMHIRIAEHFLSKSQEFKGNEPLFGWLIGVCSGQISYSKEIQKNARYVLEIIEKNDEKRIEMQFEHGVKMVLRGVGNESIEGSLSLRPLFTRLYRLIVETDMRNWKPSDPVEKIDNRMGGLTFWLKTPAPNGELHLEVVVELANLFWDGWTILTAKIDSSDDENVKKSVKKRLLPIEKFAELMAKCSGSLSQWMLPSKRPYLLAEQCAPIFELIFAFPEIRKSYQKSTEKSLMQIFEQLFAEEHQKMLVEHRDFEIQHTDKYLSSRLSIKENKEKSIYDVGAILRIMSKFGSENVQVQCLRRIREELRELPEKILRNLEVLNGNKRIETTEERKLVCDVAVLSECLGYVSRLESQLSPEEPIDGLLRAFMLIDSSQNIVRKFENQEENQKRRADEDGNLHFCSFKSTGKMFTNQHWYYCYTCDMKESIGVCSACAVNCHRGHELSYCKFGAFYCDCGSSGCPALEHLEHIPNAMSSLRGQLPYVEVLEDKPKRELFFYKFGCSASPELQKSIDNVREEFDLQKTKISIILEAINLASKKALEVKEKRNLVLEKLKIGEIEQKSEIFMTQNAPNAPKSTDFLPIRHIDMAYQPSMRDIADIIKLDNGTELLAIIPESVQTCLQFHYFDTRGNLLHGMSTLRTELEPIPFHARRLNVQENRLVVSGVHEVFAMRFSPEGNVIDRAHIKLVQNATHGSMSANPVVKATFCGRSLSKNKNNKQLLVVATLQYIRIYDLTMSETNFVEEMVLTAGNVQDFVLIQGSSGSSEGSESSELRIIVLSTTGYVYEHIIDNFEPDNNSIFLTDVINGTDLPSGEGISLHYSPIFNLIFCSFETGTHFAHLPDLLPKSERDGASRFTWSSLSILKSPVQVWREAAGIIGGLMGAKEICYIHPTSEEIKIQITKVSRPVLTFYVSASSKNEAVYSVLIYPDSPTCEIWQSSEHDLWINDVPSERFMIQDPPPNLPPPLHHDDLVLMAEHCAPLKCVDWSSRDLEQIYTHDELNQRLNEEMGITVIQQTRFKMSAKVTNSRKVIRMIRIEVQGANGPEAVMLGNIRYSVSTRIPKTFDLPLTRAESMDYKDVSIEMLPRNNQTSLKIKSLQVWGCDRSLMEEIQPIFEREPSLTLPARLSFSVLEFSNQDEWAELQAKEHLSRRIVHPLVCQAAIRALVSQEKQKKSLNEWEDKKINKVLEKIDTAYLAEWAELASWTEDQGFGEMRMIYVEQLLERLEAGRTRWSIFEKSIIRQFGSAKKFLELMRDEMRKMPLHRCQMMAQAMVKVFFAVLSSENNGKDGKKEKEEKSITETFLSIFTDEHTAHLANDMRSAVQETISRFERARKEEKSKKPMKFLKNSDFAAFYGVSRAIESKEDVLMENISGSRPRPQNDKEKENEWLEGFIGAILEKLHNEQEIIGKNGISLQISDSPSYNLSRVLATCLAICEPEIILKHFRALLKLIDFQKSIFPMSTFSNYALLRTVELLLAVSLEREQKEPEILESIERKLQNVGVREFCYKVLEQVIPYWREKGPGSRSTESRRVWLPHVPLVSSSANQPNAAVSNWPSNTEDAYVIACTDVALLIPQHLHELNPRKSTHDDKWIQKLCQLAGLSSGCSAYRQCKKLLLAICQNDEIKYKTMRDKYKMQDLLQQLVAKYVAVSKEVGGHQQLTELVDVLTGITKLALARPDMWRDVCSDHATWMLRLACFTTDCVASQVVELLIVAVRESGQLSIQLADRIIEAKNGEFLEKIIKRFLIGKDENLRWTMHGMLRSVIQLASRQNQCQLVRKLYAIIYPIAKNSGVQSAQLTDLIATYAPRVFSSAELVLMAQAEVKRALKLGNSLDNDGYRGAYRQMQELGLGWKSINFDRYPCHVCFVTRGSHETLKMSSIKSDTRYSAHAMIYKLLSNYEVSKVTVKLTDVKKAKTIRKASLYYCAKSADPVDLKLHREMWKKCAVVSVGENETSITLSLAVPIVTSSLIVEFEETSDGRANSQLHCPRCSGAVRSQSGVCESCGENAFQCIKCRAINYVDKEPFLCQTCGFCKYARIELLAQCRALPGAQHITCDTERGQCMQEMAQLLTKRETIRTKLSGYRAIIESLYHRPRPLAPYRLHVENAHLAEHFETHGVLGSDQLDFQFFQSISLPMNALAAVIRTLHHEFLQQTQQLMYLHEELNRYDHASEVSVVFHKPQNLQYYSTSETCFGCICHQILHSVALLHSACEDENALNALLSTEMLTEHLGQWAQRYEPLREEIEELLVRFMFGRADITERIENLCRSGEINISVIIKSLNYAADSTWQQKLKVVVRMAMENRDEESCLHALVVLNKFLEATKSVPVEERRKNNRGITKKSQITAWLSSTEEWAELAHTTSSTSTSNHPDTSYQWISECLFSPWMSVRAAASQLLLNLFKQKYQEPMALLILVENFARLEKIDSNLADQFMSTAHMMIESSPNVKTRLFVQKFHVFLIKKIHEECAELHRSKISLLEDHSFGERLRCFVEILTLLLSGGAIENVLLKAGADDLLIFLLHSTIFLKRLMTRRTRAIDSSRQALEKLLKRVSCRDGTKLMNVCVESLKLVKDSSTLGIIVGVMLEIMNPAEETEETFLMQIEKDVAQEDFLQGRMTHNPYSSADPGMGPLMRDIKNKICRDTEMIALLEDDNGMELLVNGNIISLALSVRDVYERIWKRASNGAPMLIVYRMRGLMGDAVETFIENFGAAGGIPEEHEEDEGLIRMVEQLKECGGLNKLMDLLQTFENIDSSSGRFLLTQLRKIFEKITKTGTGRRALVEHRVVEKMMRVIRKCCEDVHNESKVQIGLELFKVVEVVVEDQKDRDDRMDRKEDQKEQQKEQQKNQKDQKKEVEDQKDRNKDQKDQKSQKLCGIHEEDALWWFRMFQNPRAHRKELQILELTMSSIGNVILGSEASENVLVSIFPRILKWEIIDFEEPPPILNLGTSRSPTSKEKEREQMIVKAEHLAVICGNIQSSKFGIRLKQKILESGIIGSTCQYLMKDMPNLFQPTESGEWKQFLGKPSLKLILNILCGLAKNHQAIQKEIAKTTLKLLHRLENVASDNSIGTLAENVVEVLKEDSEVREQIILVREETRKKKKQMAMANRAKQLNRMGMRVGAAGEVKVADRNLQFEPMLDETDALSCCICRESVLRGARAAGVYAFAAIDTESGRNGTVSMMVMVHLECHKNAIRGGGGGRSGDEWSRAKMHNAGTKCNVITPLAMGGVSDNEWAESVRKFEADLGRSSGLAGITLNRNLIFGDMCLLVDRFVWKRSFSSQADGGGRESNMQYLAMLHLLAVSLPVRESHRLDSPTPNHRLVAFLLTELTLSSWNEQRHDVLRAALNDASTSGCPSTWIGMRPTLLTWAFVNAYFNEVVPITGDDRLEWLRANVAETINKTRKFVEDFDANVMPCEDQQEFHEVTGAPIEHLNQFLPPYRMLPNQPVEEF